MRSVPGVRETDPDAVAGLEEQRAFLLSSIQDLDREHDTGEVDDGDYEALRDDYTARAAAVIRRIEGLQSETVEDRAQRKSRPGRAIGVVAGLVTLAVVAGIVVAQASGRRDSADPMRNDVAQSTRDMLMEAQSLTAQGKILEAIKAYDKVLEVQPGNGEALTYRGWLLYGTAVSGERRGLGSDDVSDLERRALESLDRAVQADPDYADARIFRALIFAEEGRTADAGAELDKVRDDQVPAALQEDVAGLRQKLSTGTTQLSPGQAETR